MDQFEAVKDITSGNSGVVRLMQNKKTKQIVAMKYIKRGRKIVENSVRELFNHRSFRHPNIICFKEIRMYNKQENPRVLVIVTGNGFSNLYAPLIHDGRMEKFYSDPTREDRIGICRGRFRADDLHPDDIVKIVDAFPGQSIGFATSSTL